MKLSPVNVSARCWYYEGEEGIDLYVEDEDQTRIVTAMIPWKFLRESIQRKDKKRLPRRRREAV